MRRPKYLSPSAMTCWVQDPTAYYLRYMSDTPPPKEPQNKHMAIGNSFDAYVKAYLYERLVAKGDLENVKANKMDLDSVLASQVEPHMRTDEIHKGGEYLFGWYKRLGALDALMLTLGKSTGARFEMDVRGGVEGGKLGEIRNVPFRVKPDLYFVNEHGAHVLFDWKVNGFYSSTGKSPTPGYAMLRQDGKRPAGHESAKITLHKGIYLNSAKGLEAYDESWARQLSIGAWLCGRPVGDQFVGIIHQLVCSPPLGGKPGLPRVRVAEHVSHVSKDFQESVYSLAVNIWEVVNSDHIFRHLSKEESAARCELLDKRRDSDSGPRAADNPLEGLESFTW